MRTLAVLREWLCLLGQGLNRLLAFEQIGLGIGCPIHFNRWRLLSLCGCKVYLHHFLNSDDTRDLHDHPRGFLSLGLWGRYVEESPKFADLEPGMFDPEGGFRRRVIFRSPCWRYFPATHVHRICLFPGETCWTLVLAGRLVRPWGFWHKGAWVYWRRYTADGTGAMMKSCGD